MNQNSPRIFILDDEEIFSFSLAYYLKNAGFSDIHRFETSATFFQNLTEAPDVLILDHFLNDEIGLDILEEIKKTLPELKVIYLSAQKSASIAMRALKLGAFAYEEKNITDIKKIIELINSKENADFVSIDQ